MRTVPSALGTHLEGEELTLAQCVKLTRRDAQIFGFSTCNVDLVIDGVTYAATSSVSASGQVENVGTGVDNMEATGLLTSDLIKDTDLLAGKFDGAAIEVFLVNYNSLSAGKVILFSGWIGNVQLKDGQFVAELRSKSQKLSQQVGQLTTALCRVEKLGDSRCKVGVASYQFSRTVYAVTDNRRMTFDADTHATGYYDYGLVTFTSGLNTGLSREVKVHTLSSGRAVIELQEEFPFTVAVGDVATLEAGCDRRLDTCREKFSNVIDFRGEPHVPGNDKIMERGRR